MSAPTYYQCAHCGTVVDWDTDEPAAHPNVEIKTIGGRYCVRCIGAEAQAYRLSTTYVCCMRKRMGRPVQAPTLGAVVLASQRRETWASVGEEPPNLTGYGEDGKGGSDW